MVKGDATHLFVASLPMAHRFFATEMSTFDSQSEEVLTSHRHTLIHMSHAGSTGQ
jgi:hypothetical protein